MAQKSGGDKGTRILVIGMIVFVLLVGVIFSIVSANNRNHVTVPSSVSKADGYGIVFNPTAKPRLDIWEDFQCPVCQRFEAINNDYINTVAKGGKAKVVFHTMSFIGAESVTAAAAGACAADAGKYLEFHRALYANQPKTENSGQWTDPTLIILGGTAGITSKDFANCISSGKYLNWTKTVEADAAKQGINATPTVFVNGKELNRNTQYMDPAAFQAALKKGGIS